MIEAGLKIRPNAFVTGTMTLTTVIHFLSIVFCLLTVLQCGVLGEKEPVEVPAVPASIGPAGGGGRGGGGGGGDAGGYLKGPNGNNSESDYGDFMHPAPILDKFRPVQDLGFFHAFIASLSVIVVSELGDKTFFIAAIMAMRNARLTVFAGAILALTVMTVLSACLGFATTIVPRIYTYYISTALFAIFGIKMLKEGWSMSPNEGVEELEEVQVDIRKREEEMIKANQTLLSTDVEATVVRGGRRKILSYISQIFLQAFTMTFLAEWGDRSQLTTIILAARENVFGVTIGGVLGHAFCTALAVIGGRIVAQRISVRTVTIVGGVVFIIFAISALFMNPVE